MPRVLVLYNEPTLPPDHPDADSEHDILYTADTVARIAQQAGLAVSRLGVTDDPAALLAGLTAAQPDVVFNLYEGLAQWGNTEAFVSGLLELLRLPFTGCPTQPLMLCRSKPLTKRLLAGAGLPTAPFFVVEEGPVPKCPLKWPVIVKPGTEDASVGIDQASVCTTQKQLEDRVEYLRETYGPSVLVERFIRGREFNVALVERDGVLTALPFSEILFVPPADARDLWPIVSFDAKWRPDSRDFVATPAKNPAENVSPELHRTLAQIAKKAFELVGCRDYARVDLRVDEEGNPFVLEVNPNPCIGVLAGLAAGLESAKIPYQEFILGLLRAALRRGSQPELADAIGSTPPAKPKPGVPRKGLRVRPARRSDLDALAKLLRVADAGSAEERAHTLERVGRLLARRNRGGWQGHVLVNQGAVIAAAGFRPTDAAHGAFTLDLLTLAPAHAEHGPALLQAVEGAVAEGGGRVLLADVASAACSAPVRQLLTRYGFRPAGEVPDYYRDGYSRLTFAKPVEADSKFQVSSSTSSKSDVER
jgi:D-alanine-D-alanine ligase